MRSLAALALVLPLTLSACASSPRQPLPPPGAPPPAPAALPQDPLELWPELLLLPGRQADLRYVPDTLDRAAQLQRRLEAIAEILAKVADEPVRVAAVVLDRETWSRALPEREWGLPAEVGALVYATAAEGDADTVARMLDLTGGWLPPIGGVPFRGTADEAASLAASDTLLQLEVVRAFLRERGLRGAEPWIEALLAQLVTRTAWERTEAGQFLTVAEQFDRMAEVARGHRELLLSEYVAGLPLREDLAYQAAFLRGADLFWVELGERRSLLLVRNLIKAHLPVQRARLEEEVDALGVWELRHFAPAGAPNP